MSIRRNSMRLLHGTRDEKIDAGVAIVTWVCVCAFTLSTCNYYAHSLAADHAVSDQTAAFIGAAAGLIGGLKFSA